MASKLLCIVLVLLCMCACASLVTAILCGFLPKGDNNIFICWRCRLVRIAGARLLLYAPKGAYRVYCGLFVDLVAYDGSFVELGVQLSLKHNHWCQW